MKITVLIENTACDKELTAEHGLSLYIETSDKTVIFDSGQSEHFAENAQKLGVDLKKVDIAVLSHGHYDHSGGFLRFLEINDKARIYMNENVFGNHLNRTGKYIGVDQKLQKSDRITLTNDEYHIDDSLTLYTLNDMTPKYPVDSAGLSVDIGGKISADTFRHEHYLLIEDEGKKVLISGCSHKGILNIENRFEPDYLIGGFHFMDVSMDAKGQERLKEAATELLSYRTVYYTGHCTGAEQFEYMKKIMGERLERIYTGRTISI